jgi:hypothetical protein
VNKIRSDLKTCVVGSILLGEKNKAPINNVENVGSEAVPYRCKQPRSLHGKQ